MVEFGEDGAGIVGADDVRVSVGDARGEVVSFVEEQPKNTWQVMNPGEYGFFSNVNPTVDHPRWTQASERRIGSSGGGLRGLIAPRQDTLMFNGYAEEVAQLYAGMDLKKFY